MFGKNQHIDVLNIDDGSIDLLNTLMGTNSDGRKDFIFNEIDFSEVRE
jgi:hypothetical protein